MVELPDGRVVDVVEAPGVQRRLLIYFEHRMRTESNNPFKYPRSFTLIGTPSFCPAEYRDTYGEPGGTNPFVESQCQESVRSRLSGFDEQTRQRCGCVRLVENRALWDLKLRVLSNEALDPFIYSTMTLFHTHRGARETLRGFAAFSATEVRLYNAARQLVCSGKASQDSHIGNLTCFGDRVRATGTLRSIPDVSLGYRRRGYWLGAYKLPDGGRLDLVTELTDQELKQHHPNFPE